MEKQKLQHIMNQIQMSDICEQQIISAVQQKDMQPNQTSAPRHWKRRILGITAAVLGISAISMYTVAAVQDKTILELLFPDTETIEVAETAVGNCSIIDFTITDIEDITVTPMGAVRDSRSVSVVFSATADDESILENMEWGFRKAIGDNTNSTPYLREENLYSPMQSDDGTWYFIYEAVYSDEISESTVDLAFYLTPTDVNLYDEETFDNTAYVQLSVELGEPMEDMSYTLETAVQLENYRAAVTSVDIQALHMQIHGSGQTLPDIGYDANIQLLLEDGSTVSVTCNSGEWSASNWTLDCYMNEPIDPTTVVSVQIEDIIISLTDL